MIKRSYLNGFKAKFYPSLNEIDYNMILLDLKRLKGGLKE